MTMAMGMDMNIKKYESGGKFATYMMVVGLAVTLGSTSKVASFAGAAIGAMGFLGHRYCVQRICLILSTELHLSLKANLVMSQREQTFLEQQAAHLVEVNEMLRQKGALLQEIGALRGVAQTSGAGSEASRRES